MTPAEALVKRARRARFESVVSSPCVSICRMDLARPLCEGCFRTIGEIADWSRMAEDDKRAVWQRIALRAAEALA